MTDLTSLKREYTQTIWWIEWCQMWGAMGKAAQLNQAINELNLQLSLMKARFRVRGRPKGSKNKPKVSDA